VAFRKNDVDLYVLVQKGNHHNLLGFTVHTKGHLAGTVGRACDF